MSAEKSRVRRKAKTSGKKKASAGKALPSRHDERSLAALLRDLADGITGELTTRLKRLAPDAVCTTDSGNTNKSKVGIETK